jgi:hypothetical protein
MSKRKAEEMEPTVCTECGMSNDGDVDHSVCIKDKTTRSSLRTDPGVKLCTFLYHYPRRGAIVMCGTRFCVFKEDIIKLLTSPLSEFEKMQDEKRLPWVPVTPVNGSSDDLDLNFTEAQLKARYDAQLAYYSPTASYSSSSSSSEPPFTPLLLPLIRIILSYLDIHRHSEHLFK